MSEKAKFKCSFEIKLETLLELNKDSYQPYLDGLKELIEKKPVDVIKHFFYDRTYKTTITVSNLLILKQEPEIGKSDSTGIII